MSEMVSHSKRVAAILTAIVVFLFTLTGLFFATTGVIWAMLRRGTSPADYSVGDSAGWAMLLISPVALPLMIAFAAVAAFFSYLAIMKKSRSR